MADDIKVKMSEFAQATQIDNADDIIILQNGENKKVKSPILESKIITRTVEELSKDGGVSLNIVNPKAVVPTYADLASLTNLQINDAYQVATDGLAYTWNGTAFQPDGQGFKIQPDVNGVVAEGNTQAVSGDTTYKSLLPVREVIRQGKNLFNKEGLVVGAILPDGTVSTASFLRYNPVKIKVSPNTDYYGSGSLGANEDKIYSIAAYDLNDVLIPEEGLGVRQKNFTTGPNTHYIILTVYVEAVDTFQFELGSEKTSYEPYGEYYIPYEKIKDMPVTDEVLENSESLITSKGVYDFFDPFLISKTSKNLFNKDTVTSGYMDVNGNITSSVNLSYSTPIPVSVGDYHIEGDALGGYKGAWRLTAFDSNMTPIPSEGYTRPAGVDLIQYHVNEGTSYIVISVYNLILDTIQVEEGTVRTSYEPYGINTLIRKDKIQDVSILSDQTVSWSESLLGNVPLLDLKTLDVVLVAQYGQSLSIGVETNIARTTTPVNGNFMLGSSVQDIASTTLNPLINVGREDSVVSTVNVTSQLIRREVKSDLEFIATSSGVGSTTVDVLSDEYGSVYPRFLNHINNAKTAVGTKKIGCPVIIYIQGESDYTVSNTTSVANNASGYRERIDLYKTRLLALKNKMQSHIMNELEQEIPPIFFVHNPAGQWGGYKDKFVQMAQIELCRENTDMILLGSPYFVPAFLAGHLSSNGYRMWGEKIAEMVYKVLVKGINNEPLSPKRFTINENNIVIEFVVPNPPLQINTYQFGQIKNYGFDVYIDDSIALITSVRLVGNSIVLSVEADLSSANKIQVNYGTLDNVNETIGCGNICDSDTWVSMYPYEDDSSELSTLNSEISKRTMGSGGQNIFGKKYPMQNWLNVFSEIIKG